MELSLTTYQPLSHSHAATGGGMKFPAKGIAAFFQGCPQAAHLTPEHQALSEDQRQGGNSQRPGKIRRNFCKHDGCLPLIATESIHHLARNGLPRITVPRFQPTRGLTASCRTRPE